jgi:hypothetical protein
MNKYLNKYLNEIDSAAFITEENTTFLSTSPDKLKYIVL